VSTVSIAEASRQLSQLVNRASYGREIVILTSHGQAKAVLLGMDAFQELVGMREYAQKELMPLDTFQRQFKQALVEAGYDTPEKVVALVREIKREIADEQTRKPASSV
jgi:prevent-host-death family protein